MELSPPPVDHGIPHDLTTEYNSGVGSHPVSDAALGAGPSGTSSAPAASRRVYNKKTKKIEGLTSYTLAFVPGLYNIKNPAGDYILRDYNVDVARQASNAKAAQLAHLEEMRIAQGEVVPPKENPLTTTLIIHPGSRNLRIGRASDFYPHEVPNCIARPANAPHRGFDPPVPGSRAKRIAEEALEAKKSKKSRSEAGGDYEMNGEDEDDDGSLVDPVETKIGYLRDYLRNRLRQNKLTTDWREGTRVSAFNGKVKPEPLPEHNDPYRIDWTEVDGRPFVVGTEALRLPESAGYKVRYPILQRGFNQRDWQSSQLLLDDIATILQESLRTELDIRPRDYSKYSVLLIVADHGDRVYVQEMSNLLMSVMGFKEISVQQESYCAIFSAGLSSACVVDIGAQSTSVACIDDGLLNQDTRIKLAYGGDDITIALAAILQRSTFPYRDINLARAQDWIMMDNLKIRICTMEEHLVANTPWDFYVLKTEGLTQKYALRTYDENILAPLIFFDTRLIDFKEKRGNGTFTFRNQSDGVTDEMVSSYDEATTAMEACTVHLQPVPVPVVSSTVISDQTESNQTDDKPALDPLIPSASEDALKGDQSTNSNTPLSVHHNPTLDQPLTNPTSGSATPIFNPVIPADIASMPEEQPSRPAYDIVDESSRSPLDAAIAASISQCVSENKIKVASSSILLIGGSTALKGLSGFLADRLPPLLRAKGFPIPEVQIVPPPRNLNPRFVCWKGASVMCNLETLTDMWIRRDEFEAIGVKALKDRCLWL